MAVHIPCVFRTVTGRSGAVIFAIGYCPERSVRAADEFLGQLPSLPIRLMAPDEDAIVAAAKLKSTRRISYAGAFAAALAKEHDAALITGDTELRDMGDVLAIEWIGL